MKIAITGKGGVGKSTLAASLSLILANLGKKVLAIDADPDANLAHALGIGRDARKKILSIVEQKSLIEERTGVKGGSYGQIFRFNPDVSDVADKFGFDHRGVKLVVLGAVEKGGSGCACPESVFLKSLIEELILRRDEFVIIDMEAGIEHLGRASTRGVDALITVVEPGSRSVDTALRIAGMAEEIGIKQTFAVASKTRNASDIGFITAGLGNLRLMGCVSYNAKFTECDMNSSAAIDHDDEIKKSFEIIADKLTATRL
jgi:CO dehydrogenase maturation factor